MQYTIQALLVEFSQIVCHVSSRPTMGFSTVRYCVRSFLFLLRPVREITFCNKHFEIPGQETEETEFYDFTKAATTATSPRLTQFLQIPIDYTRLPRPFNLLVSYMATPAQAESDQATKRGSGSTFLLIQFDCAHLQPSVSTTCKL